MSEELKTYHMEISNVVDVIPYEAVNRIRFDIRERDLLSDFGRPDAIARFSNLNSVVTYGSVSVRFIDGSSVVEFEVHAKAAKIYEDFVEYSDLENYVKDNDNNAFRKGSSLVSPKYGLVIPLNEKNDYRFYVVTKDSIEKFRSI